MGRTRKGRLIDGVMLLDKPGGMTSNKALQKVKWLLQAAKAGHTGSLDPLATGVLPLCFGEATKFSQFLLDADKRYRSRFCLGATTTTGDADGDTLEERDASDLTRAQVEAALDAFVGDILQVPSMYSALKHQGQPLYKLARQGVEVERKARPVTIFRIDVLEFVPGTAAEIVLEVTCTKGTYIRSLAEDLGRALGCGAHVAELRRIGAGRFDDTRMVTLEALEAAREAGGPEALDRWLLPVDAPVAELPGLTLPADSGYYFRLGNPVMDPQVYRLGQQGDMVRVFVAAEGAEPRFLGIGELNDEGQVAPKRLIASPA